MQSSHTQASALPAANSRATHTGAGSPGWRLSGWLPRHPAWQLGLLLLVLLAVQLPRFIPGGAQLAAPVFPADRGYMDFDHAYYPAALAIRFDPATLYRGAAYDEDRGRIELRAPAHFLNIPIVAWLFTPLTALAAGPAGTALLAINIAIALATLGLILSRIAPDRVALRWGITLAFATSGPLLNAINLGQTTPLVLLLLLLGERHLHQGEDARAGLWLGLACLIKIPPLLFLPYFALRQRWRLVGTAMLVVLATVAVSLACYDWDLHVEYFNIAFRAQWGTSIAAHNSQSLDSFLARLLTDHGLWSWQPFVVAGWGRALKGLALAAAALACTWAFFAPRRGRSEQRSLLEYGMVMAFALLALPIAWAHYGTWLLPIVAVVGASLLPASAPDRRAHRGAIGVLVLSVLLINIPVAPAGIVQRFDDATWFRLAISHQLLGTALLLGLCIGRIRWPSHVGGAPSLRHQPIAPHPQS